MAASQPATDPSVRILRHMNADHQDSLVRYLEAYCGLSSSSARNAKLTDISLHVMTISTSSSTTYRIPFDPPLKDWSEARPRVVAMDQDCRAKLGRDAVTIKTYTFPTKAYQVGVATSVALLFICLGNRNNVAPAPGSVLRPLADKYPEVFAWLWKMQPRLFYPVFGIHVVETILFQQTRLKKYSVPTLSGLWWKWTASVFIEGFGAFHRFDEMAKTEADKKAKQSH